MSPPLTEAALAVALALALAGLASAGDPPSAAREVVRRLRAGEAFGGDATAFLGSDGRVDPGALDLLVAALRETTEDPRGEVARALVAVGRAADPLRARGGDAIRDPRVVAALVDPGLAHADSAKETCLDALVKSVPPALVAPHGAALAACLRQSPDPTVALALARARPADGRAILEAVAKADPTFAATHEVELARAALGDVGREQAIVEAFRACTDPTKESALARDLGVVGTRAALEALARALRTTLIVERGNRRRSVRLEVIAALRLAFPDEPGALLGQDPRRLGVRGRRAVRWATVRNGVE